MAIKIALAGNPNCGKTTMFNELTGSSQYVGNWPGVTVEKKEGRLKNAKDVIVVDLPGIYSLSPYTQEEVVTRNFLIDEHPDVIIDIVDATNIERNLYLTTQLLEVGRPVVIAMNMIDIVRKNGDTIDLAKLSERFGCPVIETSALKNSGLQEAVTKAIELAETVDSFTPLHTFGNAVEKALIQIDGLLPQTVRQETRRWFAIKLFERDKKVIEQLGLSGAVQKQLSDIVSVCEKTMDDDAESIITNERYTYIVDVVRDSVHKKRKGNMSPSDRIDEIITNRWLALPIFALIMWGVYYVSVSSLGAMVTDWTNNTLFSDWIMGGTHSFLLSVGTADWLTGLIVEGIISGVGTVLSFVPQMFILFFLLSILEDCGYMARVAFIMDRIFRKFGLSGKSFIPMLISSGCGVPGIMATRTIENDKDRKMTMIVTTFVPCGAKLPLIALVGGAFFPGKAWVGPAAYFLGISMVLVSGLILKKTRLFAGDSSPFVMELPQYHIPTVKNVFLHTWERTKAFVIKAFTVIFVACAVIWFLSNFSWSLHMVEDAGQSMLASIGKIIAPVFAPLGFGTWQSAVATISALVAKENAVASLSVLYGLADSAKDNPALLAGMTTMFTAASGFAFMAFNLLNPPCIAAVGALKREMGWKWMGIAVTYQTILAYIVALIINQLGSVIFLGADFGVGASAAIILIGFVLWLLFRGGKPKTKPLKTPTISKL